MWLSLLLFQVSIYYVFWRQKIRKTSNTSTHITYKFVNIENYPIFFNWNFFINLILLLSLFFNFSILLIFMFMNIFHVKKTSNTYILCFNHNYLLLVRAWCGNNLVQIKSIAKTNQQQKMKSNKNNST